MENMHDDNLMDGLRHRLNNVIDTPDDLVWENLERRLEDNRKKVLWKNISGVSLIGLFLLSLTYVYISGGGSPKKDRESQFVQKALNQKNNNPILSNGNTKANTVEANEKPAVSQHDLKIAEQNIQNTIPSRSQSQNPVKPLPAPALAESNLNKNNLPSANFLSPSDSSEKKTKQKMILSGDQSPLLSKNMDKTKPKDSVLMTSSNDSPGENKMVSDTAVLLLAKTTKKEDVTKADVKSEKPNRGKISVYSQITPVLNYFVVDPTQNDLKQVSGIESNGVFSSKRVGMSFEAGIRKVIRSHWEVFSGLMYYHQNILMEYFYTVPGIKVIAGSQPNEFTLQPIVVKQQSQFQYSMNNLGAKLNFLYTIKGDKLKQKFGAGITYQHGFTQKQGNGTYDNNGSSYLLYQLVYQMEYRVNGHITYFVQPSYSRSFFANESLQEPFKINQIRVGVGFGGIYTF